MRSEGETVGEVGGHEIWRTRVVSVMENGDTTIECVGGDDGELRDGDVDGG